MSKWLRFATGLYVSLACCLLVAAQDAAPKERIRFLDGKAELCEVVTSDAEGITLKLEGIPKPVKFRWWQLSAEDASRLRDRRAGGTDPAPAADLTVPGVRVRTVDGKIYEGVLAPEAPAGTLWIRTSEGKVVVPAASVASRDEIRVEIVRAYSPDEVVDILVGRIRPVSAEDYDRLGAELLRAKLQARAVAAFRVAELLRHPEWPEARLRQELMKLREKIDDLAVKKGVFQAEERALAGDYDAALAGIEEIEKQLAGRAGSEGLLEELRRIRSQLQAFRGMARDERIVQEGYRALEVLLKSKAMDRAATYADARAWAEDRLAGELVEHLRVKFNFSPDDVTVRRVWDQRPDSALLKHSYEDASWIAFRPELRPAAGWWSSASDAARYALLKGLFAEKHLRVVRAEVKSCGVCGGTGVVEKPDHATAVCPSCQGLKGHRVLIYR